MPEKPAKVLVAMSGGVDSSVAACLLKEQGYEVVGVFMRLGAEAHIAEDEAAPKSLSLPVVAAAPEKSKGCCSAADATDARVVAGQLDIPFYALNFEKDFGRLVDYFVEEYANARTPNPCVRCNQWLKFGRLYHYADLVGADYIATGHYSRVEHDADRPRLFRATDSHKDQSYVLFGLEPSALSRTLFPLGGMTKDEVRHHARRFGLALHDKPESQDICFVPDGDYARLVKQRGGGGGFTPGPILHVDGREVGAHQGIANFTVGQRRGLNVALGEPIYVTRIDADNDAVIVGPRTAVLQQALTVNEVNWLISAPSAPMEADVQIRYHHDAAPARINPTGADQATIEFLEPQEAVTPGQAAVFYNGNEVLGGGWIERVSDMVNTTD